LIFKALIAIISLSPLYRIAPQDVARLEQLSFQAGQRKAFSFFWRSPEKRYLSFAPHPRMAEPPQTLPKLAILANTACGGNWA
jgi:hypothetical protein